MGTTQPRSNNYLTSQANIESTVGETNYSKPNLASFNLSKIKTTQLAVVITKEYEP